MNAKAALCMAFLEGRILSIKNCFDLTGLTNIGREVPRLIEVPFDVVISRISMEGKSRYGQPVVFTHYRLNKSAEYNKKGIQKMKQYVLENLPSPSEARTDKELTLYKQQELFIKTL